MALRAGLIAVTLAGLLWLGATGVSPRADGWAALVATGDRLAGTGRTVRTEAGELSARAAYLLALHHAQDALDVSRMHAVAERLARLGEAALARHARDLAREVERDAAMRR